MLSLLDIINYGIITIFGISLSFAFSMTKENRANQLPHIIFTLCILLVMASSAYHGGVDLTTKLYPLIVHLPLFLFIMLYYKVYWSIALTSVLCAYLCCQFLRYVQDILLLFLPFANLAQICYTINTILLLLFLHRYVTHIVAELFNTSRHTTLILGTIPLMYYVFDYVTTVYSNSLYIGNYYAVQFMPNLVSIFYFIFIVQYYHVQSKRNLATQELMIQSVIMESSKKEIENSKELAAKTAVYRHDMRHHLMLLKDYLEKGEVDSALNYIGSVQSDIDSITPKHYCANDTVNLILSNYAKKSEADNLFFTVEANIPSALPISETELCTLLSNGLENALKASLEAPKAQHKFVRFICQTHKDHLLILIQNNCKDEIAFLHGLPISERIGHGYGTKSIAMIVKKYDGYYSFQSEYNVFTLKVVIPFS